MLQKHRNKASIPDGLYYPAEDMKKGTAVIRKLDTDKGTFVFAKPSTADEAKSIYGFITRDIRYDDHTKKYYDTCLASELATAYTRVSGESWKTTEFVEDLAVGDLCAVGFESNDAGKVRKTKTGETATMIVLQKTEAFQGYEDPMVTVQYL